MLVDGEGFIVLHMSFDEIHHEEGERIGEVLGGEMVENRLVEEFSVVFGGNEWAFHKIENDNLIRFK